eukprot:CAMPEP_0172156620 /NCGR_PEP_ID=MMETSP1050-20130122/3322_1 /TAXON_ID=233186 /ORGANISM="Cryptomonas curvata, Strain CCAP979/52" /LENGTH=102 /DNA_ID=CAMNT_0012825729 /DNA_START=446 /DNA_END=754 /DNA_ORIENTATION=-
MTFIQNGVEALPERLIGVQSLSSVLRPNDRGTAEIIGLEANTLYRIFCFAEDLEVPANQMTITEVMNSGIVFATDINMDISSRAIPKCLLFWGVAWFLKLTP